MAKDSFEMLAERSLLALAERVESADRDERLEVEYDNGVLTITLPQGKQYVINRHRVTGQLWWSSPVSGAKYFSLMEGQWRDKTGQELFAALLDELQASVI